MNQLLNQLVDRLLDNRIEITLCKVQGSIRYDLNTGMKSGLEIWDDDDQVRWEGRYSSGIIGGWDDLIDVAVNCMCGRECANASWLKLLVDEGRLIREVTVSYKQPSYSFGETSS